MEPQDFLKIEYESLREEIKDAKDRTFKTLVLGVMAVPATQSLAKVYEIDALALALPLLVLVFALLYLAENHTIMRCGRYIRLHIEPRVPDVTGWETWLTTPDGFEKRSVDRHLKYSFYTLFGVYYAGSIFLAARFAYDSYGMVVCSIVLGIYLGLGIWFTFYLISKILISTTTTREPPQ